MQFVCVYYNITLDSDTKQSETDVAQCISEKKTHIYKLYGTFYTIMDLVDFIL